MARDHQTNDFNEFLAVAMQAAQADSGVIDQFDIAAGLRELARTQNLPASLIRPEEEVIQIATDRAQAQATAEGLQNLQTGAQAAQTASQVDPRQLEQVAQLAAPTLAS